MIDFYKSSFISHVDVLDYGVKKKEKKNLKSKEKISFLKMDPNWPPKEEDIVRMFRQMVDQTGVEKHTSEEWQEAYEDFCRCMQSPQEPYITVSSVSIKVQPIAGGNLS